MIHLYVIKSTCGEAVRWVICPEEISLGAQGSNKVEQMQVDLPDEWNGFTVRLTFLPYRKDAIAVVLPPDGVIDITGDITAAKRGQIVIDAINGEQIAFSAGAIYFTYMHPEAGGKDPGYTPDEYQQFVDRIEDAAKKAQNAAESAEQSAERAESVIPPDGKPGYVLTKTEEGTEWRPSQGGGIGYEIGNGLKVSPDGKTLSVDTAEAVEEDNTKPVTSAAVYAQLGNVEALLASI